jgi:hypothetical protein
VPLGRTQRCQFANRAPTIPLTPLAQAVSLRASTFSGLRLHQQIATPRAQRAAVIARAEAAPAQLDALER